MSWRRSAQHKTHRLAGGSCYNSTHNMKNPAFAVLWCLLLGALTTGVCMAQNSPSPSQPISIDQIKQDVAKIGVGNKITVIRSNGQEAYGSLRRIDAEGFQIEEVDQKFTVDFKYNEVQGVRKGYGIKGYGGKRIAPSKKRWVLAAIVIAAGVASIALAVSAGHHDDF